jgi:hypothetical protein
MGGFISLIENLAPGIYVIAGLLLLWNIRSWFVSRGELRFAQYGLEKELAQRRGGRAVTLVLVMVELLIAVWAISTLAAPTWSDGLPDTPAVNIAQDFFTATPAGDGELAIDPNAPPTAGPGILATAPPPSTPVGTIGPSDPRRGCDPDRAWIQIPGNGQYVFEEMDIIGTANVPNFSKYRFEIKGVAQNEFSLFPVDYTQPVVNNVLGRVLPTALLPGEYRFRLTVFNTNNDVTGQCEITIWITEPQPSPTPLGAGVPQ